MKVHADKDVDGETETEQIGWIDRRVDRLTDKSIKERNNQIKLLFIGNRGLR